MPPVSKMRLPAGKQGITRNKLTNWLNDHSSEGSDVLVAKLADWAGRSLDSVGHIILVHLISVVLTYPHRKT